MSLNQKGISEHFGDCLNLLIDIAPHSHKYYAF